MQVLDQAPAHWFLLEEDGALYLDAACDHGAFGYSVLIALDAGETATYHREGRQYLGRLATDIHMSAPAAAGSGSTYRVRDLTKVHGARVAAAIAAWRQAGGAPAP